jgi:DNA-binding LytR/AlgR family response regulator
MVSSEMKVNDSDMNGKWLQVRTRLGSKYIRQDSIIYIKADNKSSIVYFENSTSIQTSHLLKWYQIRLPKTHFNRCHHSFIVNCRKIEYFCGNSIISKGNIRIPLSRNRRFQLKSDLESLSMF